MELSMKWSSHGGQGGLVVEAPIGEPVDNSPVLVLAPKRTYRKDPLNDFKRYTGGWNISDRHYWASVGFTAAPLFAIAAVWFLVFGLCLLFGCLCHFCCKRQRFGYSRTAYTLSLIFLILFSICAIIGCVVLYTAQERFHKSTTETLEYVVNQADATVDKLRAVSDFIASAKLVGVDQVFLPSNVQTDIDQIGTRINSSASVLADKTVDNSEDIKELLDSVRVALITAAAIMLLLTFLGFLFSIFGMQFLVYILVIVGWILVAGNIHFVWHIPSSPQVGYMLLTMLIGPVADVLLCKSICVAGDTCVAMDHWVQNPTAHTALDDILPCVDQATTQDTLIKSKEITSQLVEVVNQVITNVSNLNFSPNFKPMYINQSGPLVPMLCNPFYADLTIRPCSAGEVELTNATQVWSSYVCQVSPTGICSTTGRLTPAFYSQMSAAVNVSYGLNNNAPFLIDLGDCTFAREIFNEIYRDHCPSLRRHSRWIYIGLVMVSTAVMLSLIFWVIYGRERRHRVYSKQLVSESAQGAEREKRS
ncbi:TRANSMEMBRANE PROTEIN [Salix purpurea]|uniref:TRANSMEMBRANE PROTEIN n=1 Tax=Salix purpurea TaxID=77065 RepID=A0A9Q0ULR7_SALPP|nr:TRANSMEMBRANE PROTEIN [Salix purpurea]